MSDDEPSLWRSWRERRDERAFEALVRPHLCFATAFARRLGCGPDDADEVVQRSLVRLACESREKPGKVGVRAWLGRGVLQEARMLARSERRRARHEAAAPPRRLPGAEAVDARDEVEAALAALDEDARRAVELRFLHDLEYREVAFVLGRSPLACRLLVHRAIRRLRHRFGSSASLLVAALPRMGEVAATRATESIAVATSYGSAGSATATIAGGLAMATAGKVGGAAAVTALLAWLGWSALRPTAEWKGGTAPVATAPAVAPGLAARPPLLPPASPSPEEPASRATTGVKGAPASVPLDAPIPVGKGSVAGTIQFTDGKPLAHARVGLWGSPQVVAETDDLGRYHIHGDWVAQRVLTLLGPYDSSMDLGALASMKPAELVTLDLTIEPGLVFVVRVLDARSRAPITATQVSLRRPGANASNVMQGGFAFATTDAGGRVQFEHLPAVPYQLSVAPPGYELTEREIDLRTEAPSVDLAVPRARPILLRVRSMPPTAAGVRLRWTFQRWPGSGLVDGESVLAANGESTLDAPPQGDWRLSVSAQGWPRFETDVHVGPGELPIVEWTVPTRAAVAGRILDAAGRPITNVGLLLGDADAVRTDAEGGFRIPSVTVGSAAAYLLFDDYDSVRAGAVEVPPSGRDDIEVRAEGGASITARVPNASVVSLWQRTPLGQVATAHPRPDGSIRIPWLPGGSFRFAVVGHDAETDSRDIDLLPGQALDLGEIRLAKLPAVPVNLSLPPSARRPATLDVLFVRDVGGTLAGKPIGQGRVEFDGQGQAWLKGLPAGEFVVRVQAPGFVPVEMTIEIRDGMTTPIPIELRAR